MARWTFENTAKSSPACVSCAWGYFRGAVSHFSHALFPFLLALCGGNCLGALARATGLGYDLLIHDAGSIHRCGANLLLPIFRPSLMDGLIKRYLLPHIDIYTKLCGFFSRSQVVYRKFRPFLVYPSPFPLLLPFLLAILALCERELLLLSPLRWSPLLSRQ